MFSPEVWRTPKKVRLTNFTYSILEVHVMAITIAVLRVVPRGVHIFCLSFASFIDDCFISKIGSCAQYSSQIYQTATTRQFALDTWGDVSRVLSSSLAKILINFETKVTNIPRNIAFLFYLIAKKPQIRTCNDMNNLSSLPNYPVNISLVISERYLLYGYCTSDVK